MLTINLEIICEDSRWQAYLKAPYFKAIFFENILMTFLQDMGFKKDHPVFQSIYDLSLLLTDDTKLQALNKEFRGKDNPTNILSFPTSQLYTKNEATLYLPHDTLGDMAISMDRLIKEANTQNKVFDHHLQHLLIHSMLHLLGYDHEDERDAKKMEALEIKCLAYYNISNPYEIQ